MKLITLILGILLLSGCFFVIKEGDKVKVFGENKEIALDTLRKTEEVKPELKREYKIFQKKE